MKCLSISKYGTLESTDFLNADGYISKNSWNIFRRKVITNIHITLTSCKNLKNGHIVISELVRPML